MSRRRSVGLVTASVTAAVLALSPELAAAGSLTITGGAPGNFSATLNGKTQSAYTSLAGYAATDSTLSGAGWNVTVQASRFTCSAGVGSCPAGGNQLPLNSLLMAPPTVSCASGTLCVATQAPPSITIGTNTTIDTGGSTAVKVASAAQNTGEGTYDFSPGLVDGISGHNLKLTVPSSVYATTYASTITISIVSGP